MDPYTEGFLQSMTEAPHSNYKSLKAHASTKIEISYQLIWIMEMLSVYLDDLRAEMSKLDRCIET